MNPLENFGTGAIESPYDGRTVKHEGVMGGLPLVKGGTTFLPEDIENQHAVGICTAISRVQLREKQTGKKYSPDFQYLLQKKFIDKAWFEGSSIFAANKVAKNFGFLPLELFTWITENDRYLPYPQYQAKLKAIPDEEINRLLSLCVDKIAGYAQVDVSNPQAIARAVVGSPESLGILCRYGCQKNWWTAPNGTASWQPKDIDPLRYAPETSGHAIILSEFDYTNGTIQKLANTWGTAWCLEGSAHIDWDHYKMNEAWVDLLETPVIKYVFSRTLKFGSFLHEDVKQLQKVLNITIDGEFGKETLKRVKEFQSERGLVHDGIVGSKTNAELNKI